MVRIRYKGRLGNNLFQYALARIIAEAKGYYLEPYGGHLTAAFDNVSTPVRGDKVWQPVRKYKGHDIDVQQAIAETGHIYLSGYFQRARYYEPHREAIKRWFHLPVPSFGFADRDVVIHVRRGDDYLVRYRSALSMSYYCKLLDTIEPGRVFVTGVGIDEEVREALAAYDPIYFYEPEIDTWIIMKQFKRMIMSNSSYCWWPAFLSDSVREVYFPFPERGFWHMGGEIDLRLEDSRYRYVDNVPVDVPAIPADHG